MLHLCLLNVACSPLTVLPGAPVGKSEAHRLSPGEPPCPFVLGGALHFEPIRRQPYSLGSLLKREGRRSRPDGAVGAPPVVVQEQGEGRQRRPLALPEADPKFALTFLQLRLRSLPPARSAFSLVASQPSAQVIQNLS